MIPRVRPLPLSSVLVLVLVVLAGCQENAPPIGHVSGTVTRNGKTIPNLSISFIPEKGRPSWGLTDSCGRYTLQWDEDHDGAEVGLHKVSVAFVPATRSDQGARTKTPPAIPQEQKAIIDKYGIEMSPLTQDVKSGRQTIDLELD